MKYYYFFCIKEIVYFDYYCVSTTDFRALFSCEGKKKEIVEKYQGIDQIVCIEIK